MDDIDRLDRPRPLPYAEPFWAGIERGEFLIQHCQHCDAVYFPPRMICGLCMHDDFAWKPVDGDGEIYTFTRIDRAPGHRTGPFTLSLVDLPGGIRLLTELVGDGEPTIGAAVRFVPNVSVKDHAMFVFELS